MGRCLSDRLYDCAIMRPDCADDLWRHRQSADLCQQRSNRHSDHRDCKAAKADWLNQFTLAFSLIGAMALSVVYDGLF